ncbi:MAG: D-tyrosyl-tRNA(Tyr) deacylase [Clostridia bacterium]|nr:D-tyrosyl-tRNA(Tyr) deacylase [Clostridia bacterium]
MRTVVQRVKSASVDIEGKRVAEIEGGLLIFVGIKCGDTRAQIEWMADKIKKLRIFEDPEGKMNLSAQDLGKDYLVVSQFTLYGDCKKGTRPSFIQAAPPDEAIPLYEYFVELMKQDGAVVGTGQFGADMQVSLVNDGPVTMLLERDAQ